MPEFKSIRAAKAAGYHRPRAAEYGGDRIRIKGRVLVKDAQRAKSKSEWSREGFRIKTNQCAHGAVHGRYHDYEVYRVNQVEPKRPAIIRPPQPVDLLAAIFAVNRAAKRWRDAAQSHYQGGRHGFAGDARSKKEKLYQLKDCGIVAAIASWRIQAIEIHGGLCLYRGEGYCFHSTLAPSGLKLPARDDDQAIEVEAKPRGAKEPRQVDAVECLSKLPGPGDEFVRLQLPRKVTCRRCGQLGHFSYECPESGIASMVYDRFDEGYDDDLDDSDLEYEVPVNR